MNDIMGTLIILFIFLGLVSCIKKPVEEPSETAHIEETKPADLIHKVSFSGETLAMIANWYTGKSSNWKLIIEANPKIKPEKIALGQEIIIPGKLIIQRNPLTKKFVQESFAKRKLLPSTDGLGKDQVTSGAGEEIQKNTNNSEQEPNAEKSEHGIFVDPSQVSVGKETPDKVIKEVEEINKEARTQPYQKSDKPTNNDEEREKLLDELLTQ